jgi:choline dehydrogenase
VTGQYDVVVLGGGAAGCVLAARLSEDPNRRVCLVEAGPDYGALASGGWPRDLLDPHQLPDSHDWLYDEGLGWSARVIGGCSAHNACVITWGADADYDEWGKGWSARVLEPYRRTAEAVIGAARRERPGVWHEAVLEAAVEAGFAALDDLDGAARGAGAARVNERGGVRWNAALAYLDPARDRPNLTIIDRATADRVELRGTTVRGAWIVREGARRLLEAPTVVVCAGAYGSPAILLRSGIGAPEGLRAAGVEPVVALPAVGANLRNHFTTRIMLTPGPGLADAIAAEHASGGVPAAGTIVKAASPLCEPGLWDLHLMAICWGVRDDSGALTGDYLLRIAAAAMRPRSAGAVRLRSADPEALPEIDHQPLSDPRGENLRMLRDGIRYARRIAGAASLRALGVVEEAPGDLPDAALDDHVRGSLGSYCHPVGTCAIGSVVGGAGAVHGIDGLYVADASIIPTIPRANTHLTALAVAERIADRLTRG